MGPLAAMTDLKSTLQSTLTKKVEMSVMGQSICYRPLYKPHLRFPSNSSSIHKNPTFHTFSDTLFPLHSMTSEKRAYEDTPEIHSPEPKKLRFDYNELLLTDLLEESDPDFDLTVPDLDSVIKSLEDEIEVNNFAQQELGYLLVASDDELGLPPSTTADGVSVFSELSENWGFDEVVDLGFVDGGGEYLTLDDLFDYSDVGFGSTDNSWRSESSRLS